MKHLIRRDKCFIPAIKHFIPEPKHLTLEAKICYFNTCRQQKSPGLYLLKISTFGSFPVKNRYQTQSTHIIRTT